MSGKLEALPELVRKPQAAAMLGCKVRHIERLIARGELVKVVVGKKCVCVPIPSIRAFIGRRTEVAG